MILNSKSEKTIFTVLFHLSMWILIFLLPYLVNAEFIEGSVRFHYIVSAPLLMTAIGFYINYFTLYKLYLNHKTKYFLWNALLVLVLSVLAILIRYWLKFIDPSVPKIGMTNVYMWLRNLLIIGISAWMALSMKSAALLTRLESERRELEKLNLHTELENLRYQINPHFFFNTLNTIYALVSKDTDKARKAILKLSKMLRYVLYECSVDSVKLRKEISFLNNYMNLMKFRVGDHVDITLDVDVEDKDLELSPLLFTNLIENAFKHGVGPRGKVSYVHIKLIQVEKMIVFEIENSNYPKESFNDNSGVGIENLKRRLSLMYPDAHELILDDQGEMHLSKLTLRV